MTFPLAYQLLQRTVGVSNDPLRDTKRLICWPRVGNEAYNLHEIDNFFNEPLCLDDSVCKCFCFVYDIHFCYSFLLGR